MKQAYKDLLQKYNLLLEENKKLKSGFALFKDETGLSVPKPETTPKSLLSFINKYSSSEEKISLPCSLLCLLRGKARLLSMQAGFIETIPAKVKCGFMTMLIYISLFLKECIKRD